MSIVIGSTPLADRLDAALRACGDCTRVDSPPGGSAEERCAALQRVIGTCEGRLAVAATGEDERSLIAAALARRLGARPVIAVVESPSLVARAQALSALGIDRILEPDVESVAAATEHIIGPVAAAVHALGQGQIRTAELAIAEGCPAIGCPLRDLKLPRGARIALIHRGERRQHAIAPTASTTLESGDRVLLVANRSVAADAVARLGGSSVGAGPRAVVVGGPRVCRERAERIIHLLRDADVDAVHAEAPVGGPCVLVLVDPDEDLGRRAREAAPSAIVMVVGESPAGPVGAAVAIHAADAVARAVAAMVRSPAVEHIASLAPGVLDVYRVRAGESGEWLGGSLRQTPGMRGWIVLATQSGGHAHLPHPEDAIEPGDVLIIAGPPGAQSVLERSLAGGGARAVA